VTEKDGQRFKSTNHQPQMPPRPSSETHFKAAATTSSVSGVSEKLNVENKKNIKNV
jgi:hypothetical protein